MDKVLRFFPDYAGKKWFAKGEQITSSFNMFCYVKGMKTTNQTADDFSTYYDEQLEGCYDCVDRIVVNAYYKMAQTPGGFRTWWRQLYGSDETLDRTHIMRMAGDFSRRLQGAAKKYHIPVVYMPMGERKDGIWEQYRPEAPDFKGVFLILVGRAPAPVWEVFRRKGRIVNIARKPKWPYVNHFYIHLMDPDWGHMIIRMSSYPPFGAQIILNGHEWVACQAQRQGVPIHKMDNCFVEGSEYPALERIAKALRDPSAIGQLLRACDRWVYSSALCFGLALAEQARTRFRYSYSLFQLEYSRNLLFERGHQMEEIFQLAIERTRGKLDVKRLKTIFGFKHRPYRIRERGKKAVQLEMTIERPAYNLTVFKLRWGNLVLKMYDKGGRVLRSEAVAHNVKSLRCGTGADKWGILLERMQRMLLEFMNTLQAAHAAFLDDGALEEMAQPSQRGDRRLAGLDMNKVRLRSVADALLALSTRPGGFTAAHLVQQIRERHKDRQEYGQRQALYDLAKFTAKGLVSHKPRMRCYQIVPTAVRALAAYLIIRERVLKPILAGAGCKRLGRPPKNIDPLDTHYLNLRSELFATLEKLGIAA